MWEFNCEWDRIDKWFVAADVDGLPAAATVAVVANADVAASENIVLRFMFPCISLLLPFPNESVANPSEK